MIILRPSHLYIIQFGKSLSALLCIHKALLSVPGTPLAWQLSHLNVFNLKERKPFKWYAKTKFTTYFYWSRLYLQPALLAARNVYLYWKRNAEKGMKPKTAWVCYLVFFSPQILSPISSSPLFLVLCFSILIIFALSFHCKNIMIYGVNAVKSCPLSHCSSCGVVMETGCAVWSC